MKSSPEDQLNAAVDGDHNLDALKAIRKVISKCLNNADEPGDQARFIALFLKANSDIIKLEGKQQEFSEEENEEFDALEALRPFKDDK